MMKAIEKLVNREANKVGNHRVEHQEGKDLYFYYWTNICIVDHYNRTATVDNGGYATSSTSRAINDYVRHFGRLNYNIVDKRKGE